MSSRSRQRVKTLIFWAYILNRMKHFYMSDKGVARRQRRVHPRLLLGGVMFMFSKNISFKNQVHIFSKIFNQKMTSNALSRHNRDFQWLIIIFQINPLAILKMNIQYQLSKFVKTIILVKKEISDEYLWGYMFPSQQNSQAQEGFQNAPSDKENGQFNLSENNLLDNLGPVNNEELPFLFLQMANEEMKEEIIEESEEICSDISEGDGAMVDASTNQPLVYKQRKLRLFEEKLRLKEIQLRLISERHQVIKKITEMVNFSPPEERNRIYNLSKEMIDKLTIKRSRTRFQKSSQEKSSEENKKRNYVSLTPEKKLQIKVLIKEKNTMSQIFHKTGVSVSNLKIYFKQLREAGKLAKGMIE